MKRWHALRYWFSMAFRLTCLGAAYWCLFSALMNRPVSAIAWVGAAFGFISAGADERRAQVKRGEIDDE
jgi:hypothetical protein